jgi:uncharacterized tellurite resistance protein B-like protein
MNVDEYIKGVEAKNPRLLASEKIQIRPDALKALLRHAFNAGRTSHPLCKAARETQTLFKSAFGDFFDAKR